jgi:glycosyltransferase involved in cell wall biosynthesis
VRRFLPIASKLILNRLLPLWQRVPRQLRRRIVRLVLRNALDRKDGLAAPVAPVILCGPMRSTTSFGWAARCMFEEITKAGLPCVVADVSHMFKAAHLPLQWPPIQVATEAQFAGPATLFLALNPDQFAYVIAQLPPGALHQKYVIAQCAWELEQLPPGWKDALRIIDELWLPTEFVANAFRSSGFAGRILIVPYFLSKPARLPPVRSRFALGDEFVFFNALSLRSGLTRKNPMAAIEAFRLAFGRNEKVKLVLKISDVDVERAKWATISNSIAGDPSITVITDVLDDDEMWSLIAESDAIVSLHRSEGFAMLPVQAMLLGKPVIATGWSGNMDYMSDADTALVKFDLVPVRDPDRVYVMLDSVWAAPDVRDAASHMRRIFENRSARELLAERGPIAIARYYERHRAVLNERLNKFAADRDVS